MKNMTKIEKEKEVKRLEKISDNLEKKALKTSEKIEKCKKHENKCKLQAELLKHGIGKIMLNIHICMVRSTPIQPVVFTSSHVMTKNQYKGVKAMDQKDKPQGGNVAIIGCRYDNELIIKNPKHHENN